MKLYTKTGDDGTTGLIGVRRVYKHDPRVAAYGDVDETNAMVGLVLAGCRLPDMAEALRHIQADLFAAGAELATPPPAISPQHVTDADIHRLEGLIDRASGEVEPLRNFILPGGCDEAAKLHLARTVCRRAERSVIALAQKEAVRTEVVVYLNRLSDLLFALARLANHRAEVPDVIWSGAKASRNDSSAGE